MAPQHLSLRQQRGQEERHRTTHLHTARAWIRRHVGDQHRFAVLHHPSEYAPVGGKSAVLVQNLGRDTLLDSQLQ
jgi:hypothetical protein